MATDTTPPNAAPPPESLIQQYWNGVSRDTRLAVVAAVFVGFLGALATFFSSQSSQPAPPTNVSYSTHYSSADGGQPVPRIDSSARPVVKQEGAEASLRPRAKVQNLREVPQSGSAAVAPPSPPAAAVAGPPILNARGTTTPLAVLLLENGIPPAALTEQVAEYFRGTGSLFTPAFFRNGLFERIAAGDTAPLSEYHVERHAAAVLLGAISVTVDTDSRDQSLSVVTVSCNAKLYLAADSFNYRQIAVTGKGVDFNKERAIREAHEILFANLIATLKKYL